MEKAADDDEVASQADVDDIDELNETAWISSNIKMRRCIAFIPDPSVKTESQCQCGLKQTEHGNAGEYSGPWQYLNHTVADASKAFGEVEFPRSKRISKYVRIDAATPIQTIEELLFKQWKLKKPRLVLSVTGGAKNFDLAENKMTRFQRGIARVAQSTGAWVISGGTYCGVMKHVGKAMKNYSDPAAANEVVCLGIVTWGVIAGRESLLNTDGDMDNFSPVYDIPKEQDNKTYLDPNGHTHFLLVDDGSTNKFGREIDMRSAIEEKLKNSQVGGSLNITIPTCMVVLQGGPGTLKTVAGGLNKDTAVVIVRESGMIADVIMRACDFVDDEKKDNPEIEPKKLRDLSEFHRDAIINELKSMNPKANDLENWESWMDKCIEKRRFITLYSATQSIDLEAAILTALLNTNDELRNQLSLAIAWNRIDIAQKDILKSNALKRIDREVLEELALYAIQHDRNKFTEIFIEHGLNFKTFVTPKRIYQLYSKLPHNARLLRNLLSELKNEQTTSSDPEGTANVHSIASLYQVGTLIGEKLLTDALGHRYIPKIEVNGQSQYYVSVEDEHKLKHDHLGRLVKNDRIQAPFDPAFELFEYSILLNRLDQSMLFYEHIQDGLTGAVYAIALLKQMASRAEIGEERDAYVATANYYEALATDILKRCFEADRAHTRTLLIRQSRQVNGRTVIQLANDAEALKVLAHYAVKSLTDELWMGYIRERSSPHSLGLVAAACIVPPVLFKFNYVGENERNSSDIQEYKQGGRKILDYERHNPPTCLDKIAYFYNAPVTVYLNSFMSYCIFLILLSTETLLFFGKGWNQLWLEILLIIWVASFFFEEIRNSLAYGTGDWKNRLKKQLIKGWNCMQLFAILLFYLGVILTFVPNATAASLSAGRIFEAISLLLFFFRMYKYYAIDRKLGPQVVTMSRMLYDLAIWTAVIGIMVIAWGIAQYSLLFPQSGVIGWTLIRDVLVMPFWQLFSQSYFTVSGQFPYDNVAQASSCTSNSSLYATYDGIRCADNTGQWLVPILLGVYVVITVLLMFNILIAMFVYTVDAINEETEEYYQYQRFELISELNLAPPLVPPIVILSHIYLVGKYLVCACTNKPYAPHNFSKPTTLYLNVHDERYILTWLKGYKDEYCKHKKEKQAGKIEVLTKKLHTSVNKTHTQIMTAAAVAKCSADYSILNEAIEDGTEKVVDEADLKREQDQVQERLANTNGMLRTMLTVLSRTAAMQQANELDQSKQILTANKERRAIFNTHQECRNQKYPGTDQLRTHVPDNKVDWNTNWPKYHPPRHSDNQVSERYVTVDEEQADGSPPALAFNQYDAEKRVNRISSGVWYVVEQGYPLNPVGRTGMGGRGTLPLWGPNHAVCCAFTRVKSRPSKKVVEGKQRKRKPVEIEETPVFQILAIFDDASQKWIIPMSVFGSVQQSPNDRIKKHFEALILASQYDEQEKAALLQKLSTLFDQNGKMVRVGYYDSAYNTDNAWIEACCLAFHDSEGCTADLDNLEGFGVEAEWFDFHNEALFYGGQRIIIRRLAEEHNVYFPLEE